MEANVTKREVNIREFASEGTQLSALQELYNTTGV